MNFSGKVAISTGAASGMGLLFAENFASLGGNVVLCDVNEEVLIERIVNRRSCPKCGKIRLTNIAKKELSSMLQNVKFKKEDKYV